MKYSGGRTRGVYVLEGFIFWPTSLHRGSICVREDVNMKNYIADSGSADAYRDQEWTSEVEPNANYELGHGVQNPGISHYRRNATNPF